MAPGKLGLDACGEGVIVLSREDKDLGIALQTPPGSQASPRGEAKDCALLSSHDAPGWGDQRVLGSIGGEVGHLWPMAETLEGNRDPVTTDVTYREGPP